MNQAHKSLLLAGAVITALSIPGAKAADIEVIMALPSPTLTFSAPFLAQDGGYYAKEGLKVSDRNLTGVASTNAVIAGSADFTVSTGATFARAVANGQKLYAIAVLVNKPLVELVMRKDVADAAHITEKTPLNDRLKALKGKTVAVQGIGSIIHSMERLAARRVGLDPDKDVTVAPMEPPQMLPAMMAKQIDAFATSLPFTTEPIVKGQGIMLASGPAGDLPEYNPFAYDLVQTRKEVCDKDPEKCRKVAHALSAAASFIVDHPDEALNIIKHRFAQMDPTVLNAAWKVVASAHTKDTRVTLKSLQNAQQFTIDSGLLEPKDELKDFSGLYTDEFVK